MAWIEKWCKVTLTLPYSDFNLPCRLSKTNLCRYRFHGSKILKLWCGQWVIKLSFLLMRKHQSLGKLDGSDSSVKLLLRMDGWTVPLSKVTTSFAWLFLISILTNVKSSDFKCFQQGEGGWNRTEGREGERSETVKSDAEWKCTTPEFGIFFIIWRWGRFVSQAERVGEGEQGSTRLWQTTRELHSWISFADVWCFPLTPHSGESLIPEVLPPPFGLLVHFIPSQCRVHINVFSPFTIFPLKGCSQCRVRLLYLDFL